MQYAPQKNGDAPEKVRLRLVLRFRGVGGLFFIFFLLIDLVVVFDVAHNDAAELAQAGTGRNEVAADDVLLHAFEVVGLTADGGFVEHLGGLLEGGG